MEIGTEINYNIKLTQTIDPSNECTFGEHVTPVMGNDAAIAGYQLIRFPIDFKWPVREENEATAKQGCQMAKCDPFLSLDCARVEGVGAPGWRAWGCNPRKGRDQILQCSVAEP